MEEKKVNIFGTEYTIKYVDSIKSEDNLVTDGLCDPANRTITIVTKQPNNNLISKQDVNKNTLHELIHAFLDEGQYLEYSDNEPLIEWLARCFYSILKQDVFHYLDQLGLSYTLPDQQLEINFDGLEGK